MRLRRVLASLTRDIGNRDRLIMAGKAAFAAALAWYLAPFVPFADDDYTYFAPLGVVISMYPTLMRSARSGLQSLIGLAFGIGLGAAALILGEPRVLGVVVVGAGVLLAGLRVLGTGHSWVPITALFVLLIGAAHADDYSISYLVDMAFGILVGVLVNAVVFPPLYLRRAANRLGELAVAVARQLDDVARAMGEETTDRERLIRAMDDVDSTAATVGQEVHEANESRKGNPRGLRTRDADDRNYWRLRALQRITFFTRDLVDVLGDVDGERMTDSERQDLCIAIVRTGDLVRLPGEDDHARRRLAYAEEAVATFMRSLDERDGNHSPLAHDLTASVCLQRIVAASRPFIRP